MVWSVVLSVLGELAIGAAVAAGGDPVMGIAAAVGMFVCGLALITAQVIAEAESDKPDPTQTVQLSGRQAPWPELTDGDLQP